MTSLLVICIGTGFTTSGAATDSLSLITAPEHIAEHNGVAHRSGLSSPGRDNRFAGSDVLGGRTVVRTLGVASESGGKADLERCPRVARSLRFYRSAYSTWMAKRGVRVEFRAKPSACPRYLLNLMVVKAESARADFERSRTLVDFPIRPGNRAWLRAVEQAQRPYPGTRSWLLSCSASEGGHGRWVVHGGAPYYSGAEYDDISSGHLQFKPGTFKGFYRHAVDDLRSRGFRVPVYRSWVDAWRSATAQALAGAWGLVNGYRGHWAGSGCR